MEATRVSTDEWKNNIVHPYDEILIRLRKDTLTCYRTVSTEDMVLS